MIHRLGSQRFEATIHRREILEGYISQRKNFVSFLENKKENLICLCSTVEINSFFKKKEHAMGLGSEDFTVLDLSGNVVNLASLCEQGPCLLVFLRHYG